MNFYWFLGFGFVVTFGLFLASIHDAEFKFEIWVHLIPAAILMGMIISKLLGS